MKQFYILLSLCFFFFGAMPAEDGLSDGLFLENGVGLPGELEIGQKGNSLPEGKEGEWLEDPSGLKFKVDTRGVVALILCEQKGCIAEHNVGVGTPAKILLRRYGAPNQEKRLKNGVFFRYQGVGFRIQKEIVEAIYIFP